MTAGAGQPAAEPDRPVWALAPLDGVGPLRFGMSADETRAAVPDARELGSFQADPHFTEMTGIAFGLRSAERALFAYFDGTGRLFCVSADAGRGPQVTLNGLELTGREPAVLEQIMLDSFSSPGCHVSYGPRGNPGVDALGLVVRVQVTATGLLTRPVLVGREWADRCTDDWEGLIPECEWLGWQWPYPGHPAANWSPPGYNPRWPRGWRPPF